MKARWDEHKAQVWAERIAAFERSDLSRRAWCASQGLNKNTLDYWRARLRARDEAKSMTGGAPGSASAKAVDLPSPALVPIVVSRTDAATDDAPAGEVRIALRNEVQVIVTARTDAIWLATLLGHLSRC